MNDDGGTVADSVSVASGIVTLTTSRPNAVIGSFQATTTDGIPVQGSFEATCIAANAGCD